MPAEENVKKKTAKAAVTAKAKAEVDAALEFRLFSTTAHPVPVPRLPPPHTRVLSRKKRKKHRGGEGWGGRGNKINFLPHNEGRQI